MILAVLVMILAGLELQSTSTLNILRTYYVDLLIHETRYSGLELSD